jgi:hypothetical protein
MKLPKASADSSASQFVPDDFSDVIAHLPEGCALVGGQAVAWWARTYGIKIQGHDKLIEVTSQDIDFWGSRADLIHVAKALRRRAVFPNQYEMTVWAGAVPIKIKDQESLAEFLHTVPGLDTADPEAASVPQIYEANSVRKTILILTPVSLILAKVHAVRHFDQQHRNDEQHLRVCITASQHFIRQLLRQNAVRHILWNCERLITLHQLKPIAKLEQKRQFNVLDAVPIADLESWTAQPASNQEDRDKISNFVNKRWTRLGGS